MRIYTASKTKHAARWREMRKAGVNVIATWIDEADAGQTSDWVDLWHRCVDEAKTADVVLLYHEPGDELKGALVEVGAALACGVPVVVVGDPPGSWTKHALVSQCASLDDAMALITTPIELGAA